MHFLVKLYPRIYSIKRSIDVIRKIKNQIKTYDFKIFKIIKFNIVSYSIRKQYKSKKTNTT